MTLIEQSNKENKATAKQRSPQPDTEDFDFPTRQSSSATAIQQPRLDPRALTPQNVLQFQGAIGNQAVGQLLAETEQGRVQPTIQANGVAINDDEGLESEADAMGERALQNTIHAKPEYVKRNQPAARDSGKPGPIQREITDEDEKEALQKELVEQCFELKLDHDAQECQQALQDTIEGYDNGELMLAKIGLQIKLMGLVDTSSTQGVSPALSYDEAIAMSKKERERIKNLIEEGTQDKQDIRWSNTCQWIKAKVGGVFIYALTLTDDSEERVEEDINGVGYYFPDPEADETDIYSNHDYSNYAPYDDSFDEGMLNLDNLTLGPTGTTDAGAVEGKIIFYQSSRFSDVQIKAILIHELQHIADKSAELVEYWKTKDLAESCLERYKTEYRAHWYEGTFDGYNPMETIEVFGYEWTRRQYEVFKKIYGAYNHTKLAWDFSNVTDWGDYESQVKSQTRPKGNGDYVNGEVDDQVLESINAFRAAIVNYKDPDVEGANKFNSPWLDDFYVVLTNDQMEQSEWEASLKETWQQLTPEEQQFVIDSKTYESLLSGETRTKLIEGSTS